MQSVCIFNKCPDDETFHLRRLRLKLEILWAEQANGEANGEAHTCGNLYNLKMYL